MYSREVPIQCSVMKMGLKKLECETEDIFFYNLHTNVVIAWHSPCEIIHFSCACHEMLMTVNI